MIEIKMILSLTAIALTLLGYLPYLKDTISKKTTPHIYTWFIWGLVTAIAYGLQVNAGAGIGSWVTLVVAIVCFIIFGFGLKNGNRDITKSDTTFFILSILAMLLWLIAKQPLFSVLFVSFIDILGFIPTIRKSWKNPFSETLISYEINSVRHGLSILALQEYNIVTWLYPATWVLANGLFSLMLIIRRRQVLQ